MYPHPPHCSPRYSQGPQYNPQTAASFSSLIYTLLLETKLLDRFRDTEPCPVEACFPRACILAEHPSSRTLLLSPRQVRGVHRARVALDLGSQHLSPVNRRCEVAAGLPVREPHRHAQRLHLERVEGGAYPPLGEGQFELSLEQVLLHVPCVSADGRVIDLLLPPLSLYPEQRDSGGTVSYTHLTLPTIYSV